MSFDVRPEKQWLTACEAAAEQLPGFVFTEQHIRRLIVSDTLKSRARQSSGGRPAREFHWTDLPREAKAEYLKRHGAAEGAIALTGEVGRDLKAEARGLIAESATAFIAARNLSKCKGLKTFCIAYQKHRVKLDDWVLRAIPDVTPLQVRTWQRLAKTNKLLDRRGRPKKSGIFHTDLPLKNYTIAAVAARPHLSGPSVQRLIATDLGREIPLRTVQDFLKTLRTDAPMLKLLTDPDRFRSHHQPAFGTLSPRDLRINQIWMIDASPADAMCRDEHGKPVRVKLTAVIDVFTRRAKVLVSDQARSIATMALLRRAILAFGMPEQLKCDNGKEFKSHSVQAFCRDLGIAQHFARPFSPEQKGHIERFFGTLNRDLFEILPGYVGHSVAQRNAIENRKSFAHRFGDDADLAFEVELSPVDLQARVDAWCSDIYEQRAHEGLGLTPFAKALAHQDEAKALADERLLDTLLLTLPGNGGIRIVGKRGIQAFGRNYIADTLVPGYPVSVRHDPADPSRVVVYNAEGTEFLCVAVDPLSISEREQMQIAIAAKKNVRDFHRNTLATVRKVQQLYPAAGAADRVLNAARGGIALADDAKAAMLAAHPPKLLEHSRALDAASRGPQPIEATEEDRAAHVALLAEFAPRQSLQQLVACDGYERPDFSGDDAGFWHWATAHRAAGLELDAQDARVFAALAGDEWFQRSIALQSAKTA